MGLRFTDSQQPNYPALSSFRTSSPFYSAEQDAWVQKLPRYYYEVDVEFDPRARRAPPPRQVETWRIGLVQNVLHEQIRIGFYDQDPYEQTWRRPALDIGSDAYRPFYNEPYFVNVSLRASVDGIDVEVEDRVNIVAVHELLYGTQGLGRLYDPWDPSGYVPMPNQVIRLRMEDQPFLTIRNHYADHLEFAEQVLVMRFWVIAQGPNSRPLVLGRSPPFTLVSWLRVARRTLRSIQPRPDWGSYSLSGTHPRIIRNRGTVRALQERAAPLAPIPASGPMPLLSGPSANERTTEWMVDNHLLPPRGDPVPR